MRARIGILASTVCVVALAAALSGCDGSASVPGATDQVTRLRVSGSGTCLPLLRILAAEQPDERVRLIFLPGLHSGGGIKGAAQGSLDIGAVSRDLTEEEKAQHLEVTWLASDGLVVAANQSVGRLEVAGLTTQQVRDIYAGKITDWKEVGATKSLPIVVLDRHEDESAKIIFREHVIQDLAVTDKAVNLYYESDMVDALQTSNGAIGYFSMGYALSQNIPATLLSLDGVAPTVGNVDAGTYKVVRPLGIVTKTDAPEAVRAFVSWATGPDAQRIMREKGYVPYSK